MRRCAIVMLGVLLLGGCGGDYGVFHPLRWLEGSWECDQGDTVTEEFWTDAAGGSMFGVNRVIADGRTVFFEHLRIEHRDGEGLVYLASPAGRQPPTVFRRKYDGDGFSFENPDHDWPQRIIYRRDGRAAFVARAEGVENGREKAAEWRFRRR